MGLKLIRTIERLRGRIPRIHQRACRYVLIPICHLTGIGNLHLLYVIVALCIWLSGTLLPAGQYPSGNFYRRMDYIFIA